MARRTTQGICTYCGGTFGKRAIYRHLTTCKERVQALTELAEKKNIKSGTLLHLQIEGEYASMYWLHVEVPAEATLKHLDQFLRDIWLECCGHLSAFTFDEKRYSSYPMIEYGEKGLSTKLGKVFGEGVVARHEYDFGSTTELIVKYIGEREGHFVNNVPVVMARNVPPEILCDVCGEPATEICPMCLWEDAGLLCEKHAKKHPCGDEMLLPVVNSPRVGVCGYTGDV